MGISGVVQGAGAAPGAEVGSETGGGGAESFSETGGGAQSFFSSAGLKVEKLMPEGSFPDLEERGSPEGSLKVGLALGGAA